MNQLNHIQSGFISFLNFVGCGKGWTIDDIEVEDIFRK